MKTCDICLEEDCKGKHNCHCSTCELFTKCYRKLHPTVRITNKCTQKCGHCCFDSSPDSKIAMSVSQAEKTAKFLKSNEVLTCQIMGGEFFCNPDWLEVMSIIVDSVSFVRIVSNGDWATSDKVKNQLATFIGLYSDKIRISLSYDKWHTNANIEIAEEFLKDTGVNYNIPEIDFMTDNSIVPVGRGEFLGGGFYSFMGTYCSKPEEKYGFLIDEIGNIYKCPMGILNYAVIDDYLDGGFAKRFKEFNMKFHSTFISSCASCYRYCGSHRRTVTDISK